MAPGGLAVGGEARIWCGGGNFREREREMREREEKRNKERKKEEEKGNEREKKKVSGFVGFSKLDFYTSLDFLERNFVFAYFNQCF